MMHAPWGQALQTPQYLHRRPLRVHMGPSAAAHFPPRLQAMLRGSLQKMFGPWDTLFLGVGIVIGSGWAQVHAVVGSKGPGLVWWP